MGWNENAETVTIKVNYKFMRLQPLFVKLLLMIRQQQDLIRAPEPVTMYCWLKYRCILEPWLEKP